MNEIEKENIASEEVSESCLAEEENSDADSVTESENPVDKEQKTEDGKTESKPFSEALDWVNSIVYAVVAMLILNLFLFRSITVSGDSMNNTLVDGNKVILTNFFYSPSYGDIVVVQANKLVNKNTGMYGEPIIKRVIAVEGDTVRIDFTAGEVYVNDNLLEEDYIKDLTHLRSRDWMESGKTYTVPDNCVFVMGDNRNVSNDSRNLVDVGFIDENMIMGRAIVRFSPIKEFKWL